MAKSSTPRPSRKPEKPYPHFPLTPRSDGRWMRKVFGKVVTFSGTADEALAAYETYVADRTSGETIQTLQVRDLLEAFMSSKDTDRKAGQIAQRTFDEYRQTCDAIYAYLGRLRPLDTLTPQDAEALRGRLITGVGVKTQQGRIARARVVFKYGEDTLLLKVPFHLWLKVVSQKVLRQYRAKQPSRMLAPAEIKQLLQAAAPPMHAMILMAVNCGFGNGDCAQLTWQWLDLENGWHTYPRPKTGENRKAKLWPVTVEALRNLRHGDVGSDLVFTTTHGTPWSRAGGKTNPLSHEFRKLCKKLELYRPGVSFYSLRHVCETIAGGSRDQIATNYVMGHVDNSVSRQYRESIEDERLVAVAEHLHRWLYGQPMEEGGRGLKIVG